MCGSRNFCQEGWGRPGPTARKQSGQLFIYLFVLVLKAYFTIYRRSPMIYYGEIYTLPKIKRESNIIRGGGGSNFYQREIHFLISRNPYNLWFQGGPDPLSPYWIRTCHGYRDTKLCTISSNVFLVLKRIVPLRRFFLIPTAHVVVEI